MYLKNSNYIIIIYHIALSTIICTFDIKQLLFRGNSKKYGGFQFVINLFATITYFYCKEI